MKDHIKYEFALARAIQTYGALCRYCKSIQKNLLVNFIDSDMYNTYLSNLEVVCPDCFCKKHNIL